MTSKLIDHDLNALNNLFLLYDTGSVSRAAEVAGITQPSMSRALQKLREQYNDRLFIRHKDTLVATPRAEQLVEHLRPLFQQISQVIHQEQFDPTTATGNFLFKAPSIIGRHALPQLMATLADKLPGIDVQYAYWDDQTDLQISRGDVDLAFGFMPQYANGIKKQAIGKDRFVVLHGKDHPYSQSTILAEYAAYPHIQLMLSGFGKSIIDDLLAQHGLTRRVALRTPEFDSTLALLADTPYLLTAPLQLAKTFINDYAFSYSELPFPSPEFSYCLYWGAIKDHDILHQTLREHIARIFIERWPELN